MTNTTTTNELEQAVLAAARELGGAQVQEIRANRQYAILETRKAELTAALAEAEFKLAAADLAYATAKHHKLLAERHKSSMWERYLKDLQGTETARRHLWTVASSGDEELILAAAHELGRVSRICWASGQARDQANLTLAQAEESLRINGEVRKHAVQERGRTKAAVEALQAEMMNLRNYYPIYDLEGKLVDAAQALCGTSKECYAYSYVETADLPIVLPEDRVPEAPADTQ